MGSSLCRQRTAWIAALSLLLAQAIGLAHGIAHSSSRGGLPAAQALVAAADGAAAAYPSHDDGSAQCRVLDHLTHADALASALFDAPVVVPPVPLALAVVTPPPRRLAWRCLARGPPPFLA